MGTVVYSAAEYTAFIKNRFPQRKIESVVVFGKPFLEEVTKSDELTGNVTIVPLETDQPQGISVAIGTAQANAGSTRGVAFQITRAKGYAVSRIDGETLIVTRDNEGAFFRAREREVRGVFDQLGQYFEMQMWRSGNGSLGTLSADPGTGTTFTLVLAGDAINFHEGMNILFYADSSGNPGTVRAGGARTVTGVNYDTNVITVSAALDAALAAGDHVAREGDVNAYIKGIPGWIPASDPTDTWFNVPRTLFPQKLGGHRQSWLGSIEETVKRLDAKIRRLSQTPKTLWLSFENFNRLDLELGARGYRMETGGQGVFGRPSLMMATPSGGVTVKAGPYVPSNAGFLLDMPTWKLMHAAPLPHIIQDDGNTALRLSDADSIEMRWRWLAQLVCLNPFANGRAEII